MCVSDADYVVCAFETKKGISPTYCDQVIWSHSTKRRQDADARVIPVFCDMTAEEADALLDRHTGLAFLKLYVAAYTKDEDCLEAIMHRITTPSLGESKSCLLSPCPDGVFCYIFTDVKLEILSEFPA